MDRSLSLIEKDRSIFKIDEVIFRPVARRML